MEEGVGARARENDGMAREGLREEGGEGDGKGCWWQGRRVIERWAVKLRRVRGCGSVLGGV